MSMPVIPVFTANRARHLMRNNNVAVALEKVRDLIVEAALANLPYVTVPKDFAEWMFDDERPHFANFVREIEKGGFKVEVLQFPTYRLNGVGGSNQSFDTVTARALRISWTGAPE